MKIGVLLLIVIVCHLLNMAASKNRLSWAQTWVSLSRSTEWGPIFWTQNLPEIHNLNLLLLSEGSEYLALLLLRQRLQCSCPWKSALGPPALPGLLPVEVPFSISSVMDSIWKKTSSSWGSWDKKRGCWYFNLQNKLAQVIFPSSPRWPCLAPCFDRSIFSNLVVKAVNPRGIVIKIFWAVHHHRALHLIRILVSKPFKHFYVQEKKIMSICYIKVNHHGKALKIDRIKKQGNIDGPCIIFKSRENTGGSYLMWESRENTGGPVNMSKSSNPSLRSSAWASLTFDRCSSLSTSSKLISLIGLHQYYFLYISPFPWSCSSPILCCRWSRVKWFSSRMPENNMCVTKVKKMEKMSKLTTLVSGYE